MTAGLPQSSTALATSKPSASGILMSSSTTSGRRSRMALIAWAPSLAAPTISTSGIACSARRMRRSASGSSSASSRRRGSADTFFLQRQPDIDATPLGLAVARGQARAIAVNQLEALARIGETDAAAPPRIAFRGHAGSVVLDADAQEIAVARGRHVDAAAFGAGRDGVLDGVLEDGLQDEAGHARVLEPRLDGEAHFELVVEAGLLDFEIFALRFHFGAEPGQLGGLAVERIAQEAGELQQH